MKHTLIEGKGIIGIEVLFSNEELTQLFITASLLRGQMSNFFDHMDRIEEMGEIEVKLDAKDIEAMNCLSSFALKLGSCGTRLHDANTYRHLYDINIPMVAEKETKQAEAFRKTANPKDFEVQP